MSRNVDPPRIVGVDNFRNDKESFDACRGASHQKSFYFTVRIDQWPSRAARNLMHGRVVEDDFYCGLQVDSQAASGSGWTLFQKALVLPEGFISFCTRPLSALLLPFPEHTLVA